MSATTLAPSCVVRQRRRRSAATSGWRRTAEACRQRWPACGSRWNWRPETLPSTSRSRSFSRVFTGRDRRRDRTANLFRERVLSNVVCHSNQCCAVGLLLSACSCSSSCEDCRTTLPRPLRRGCQPSSPSHWSALDGHLRSSAPAPALPITRMLIDLISQPATIVNALLDRERRSHDSTRVDLFIINL